MWRRRALVLAALCAAAASGIEVRRGAGSGAAGAAIANAAEGAAQAKKEDPGNPVDPSTFYAAISKLLTCSNLENKVVRTCGKLPVFQAVPQFEGKLTHCVAALTAVPEIHQLLVQFFGIGADCETQIKLWRIGGFDSADDCVQKTRMGHFGDYCKIPVPKEM